MRDDHEDDDERVDDATDEERQLAREIVELLRDGKRIEAVKRYREATGVGLKESLDFVNEVSRRHGIAQSSGCGASVLVLVGVAVLVLFS